MATSYTILKEIAQVADSAASVYTNPASTTTFVVSIILHNTNTTTETVELWNVPDDSGVGTAADANKFWEDDMAANETVFIELPKVGIILSDENDSIQASTTTASKVTIQIFGRKDT